MDFVWYNFSESVQNPPEKTESIITIAAQVKCSSTEKYRKINTGINWIKTFESFSLCGKLKFYNGLKIAQIYGQFMDMHIGFTASYFT